MHDVWENTGAQSFCHRFVEMLNSLSFGKCWDGLIFACLAVPRREEASNEEALAQKKRMQPNKAGCLQATGIIVVCRH